MTEPERNKLRELAHSMTPEQKRVIEDVFYENEVELTPCSCGGFVTFKNEDGAKVYCMKCGMSTGQYNTSYEAANAWNGTVKEREIILSKEEANNFYKDLCGTFNHDSTKTCQGIASISLIAERMEISEDRTMEFCNAMLKYGITERQGGGIVI